jgi:hypothetical protein
VGRFKISGVPPANDLEVLDDNSFFFVSKLYYVWDYAHNHNARKFDNWCQVHITTMNVAKFLLRRKMRKTDTLPSYCA